MTKHTGKYARVLPGLQKLQPEPSYQQKVDDVKKLVTVRNPYLMADVYIGLRERKAEIEGVLSKIQLQLTAYEQLLTESQENGEQGWGDYGVNENSLRLANGDTIRIQPEPYGKVTNKEVFRLWCIANGYEQQLQLWPSTMNAIVKERLLHGELEPDGTEAFSYTKVIYVPQKDE